MSALADIALAKGDRVTGSDLRLNNLTEKLADKGAKIFKGHFSDNVREDMDLVICSASIKQDNSEMLKAKEMNIPVMLRSEMLKHILDENEVSVAVTGTHGKTTTSALIAHITEYSGKDPTVIVGGEINTLGGNSKTGHGGIIVAEIDESDGYFRDVTAKYAVITNIEREHMETYGTLKRLKNAYKEFAGNVHPGGVLIFNGEDRNTREIIGSAGGRTVSFGMNKGLDITCRNAVWSKGIEFDLIVGNKEKGRIKSRLIGRYNLMNILAAVAVCREINIDMAEIIDAVAGYSGVKRRFELVGKIGHTEVIEDYAHQPTELRSVISAAKDYTSGKVIAVFQPHRYSRTKDLLGDFSGCFYDADILILSGIYSADEETAEGIGTRDLYGLIDKTRFERTAVLDKEAIPALISQIVEDKDTVLVLGAGDIREIAPEIVKKIEVRAN